MRTCRKDDFGTQSHFQSNRFTEEDGKWYFYTREGNVEGPCDSMAEAVTCLERYIRTMNSELLPGRAVELVCL